MVPPKRPQFNCANSEEPVQAGSDLAARPPCRPAPESPVRPRDGFCADVPSGSERPFRFACVPFPSTRFRSGLTLSSAAPAPRDLRVPLGVLRPFALNSDCVLRPSRATKKSFRIRFLWGWFWGKAVDNPCRTRRLRAVSRAWKAGDKPAAGHDICRLPAIDHIAALLSRGASQPFFSGRISPSCTVLATSRPSCA